MAVTSIAEMVKAGGPKEVEISGWDGQPMTVKLIRPSLYSMAAGGAIPNPLLPVADALFMMNGSGIQKLQIDDMAKMMRLMAKEALVEPTLEEIEGAGLTLTDTQYNEIYAFVIGGAKTLETFRRGVRLQAGGDDADHGVPGV